MPTKSVPIEALASDPLLRFALSFDEAVQFVGLPAREGGLLLRECMAAGELPHIKIDQGAIFTAHDVIDAVTSASLAKFGYPWPFDMNDLSAIVAARDDGLPGERRIILFPWRSVLSTWLRKLWFGDDRPPAEDRPKL